MNITRMLTAAFLYLLTPFAAYSASELVASTPESVDGATTVDVAAAHGLFENEVAFIDLRKENAWEAGRIPGAIHMDFKETFSKKALESEVGKEEAVVFYCSGTRCPRSGKAAAKTVGWGYQKVYYFRAGFPSWKKSGYPVE